MLLMEMNVNGNEYWSNTVLEILVIGDGKLMLFTDNFN